MCGSEKVYWYYIFNSFAIFLCFKYVYVYERYKLSIYILYIKLMSIMSLFKYYVSGY